MPPVPVPFHPSDSSSLARRHHRRWENRSRLCGNHARIIAGAPPTLFRSSCLLVERDSVACPCLMALLESRTVSPSHQTCHSLCSYQRTWPQFLGGEAPLVDSAALLLYCSAALLLCCFPFTFLGGILFRISLFFIHLEHMHHGVGLCHVHV